VRWPDTTQELATNVGRHPNTVGVQLQRLVATGLVERRAAYGQLSRCLARALGGRGDLAAIQATGREIGAELAAEASGRSLPEGLHYALAAFVVAPHWSSSACSACGACCVTARIAMPCSRTRRPFACCIAGSPGALLDRLAPRPADRLRGQGPVSRGCKIERETRSAAPR
jgi:hypothetical protein